MFDKRMLGVVGACLFAGGAFADTLIADYEAPKYGLGSTLTGQNNWEPLVAGYGMGTIQNGTVFSGLQAVTLNVPAKSPARVGALWHHTGLLSTPENPTATVEWYMLALDGSSRSDLWGVSSMWGSDVERLTVGIDANNKLVVRNGWIGTVVTNVAIGRNQWNKYRMELNYQTDKGSVFFNDAFVGQWTLTPGADEHTDTVLFNSFGGNDGAIYDGLTITAAAAPVPEPATIVGASLGLIALIRRKRSK
jgi:hypothetical protein